MIKIKIADIVVEIDNKYEHIEWLARDFLTDDAPDFSVAATDEEIERERGDSCEEYSNGYLESIVIYRHIAEKLPLYDAVVFHAATISLDGVAYAFTAPSGTGKTTHTRLWLSYFGERAEYINGDKPILRFINGAPIIFGTPWRGKESYGGNKSAPLGGIVFLSRGEENIARELSPDDAIGALISQLYIPKCRETAPRALMLCNRILEKVKLVSLKCNMDKSAPKVPAHVLGVKGE